ncbi:MAG: YdcF family protein [Oscillospiraceae bacterium]|nr:YdcF family protein [Oscillospiraceae bacterium]
MTRKMVGMLLSLCLLVTLSVPVQGRSVLDGYKEKLIQYYYHYGSLADDVIWDILRQMEDLDPAEAAVWRRLMADWAYVNSAEFASQDILPDGLPEDDSLCIVVLGYALAEDGSMQEELIDRLVVALGSALKYPNAYIALTGGQTSEVKGATEAGQMAAWLQKKGISQDRILVDKKALSTNANAENVYAMLNKSYPQVDTVAVITSDYHLSWGSALLAAVANYEAGYHGGNPIEVAAGAVCKTGKTWDTLQLQAWGIMDITGTKFDPNEAAPVLYAVERPAETQPQTEVTEAPGEKLHLPWQQDEKTTEAEEPQSEKKENLWIPIVVAAVTAAYVLTPKKPKKKREKPEWKWE